MDPTIIQKITIYAIPFVLAITLRESAKAFATRYFGDNSAFMMGRMTFNPAAHIDFLWTIVVPLVLVAVGSPLLFGGAKPLPINYSAMRNPKRDAMWVAATGLTANLVMMLVWAIVFKLSLSPDPAGPVEFLLKVAQAGIAVNASLMVFFLFPILPLDGGRILAGLLPPRMAYQYSRLEPYGMFIVLALMFTPVFGWFFGPLVYFSQKAVYSLIGIS